MLAVLHDSDTPGRFQFLSRSGGGFGVPSSLTQSRPTSAHDRGGLPQVLEAESQPACL